MYSISLVQPNFSQGSHTYKSYWLPHSIACVYTYTAYDPDYRDIYSLNQLIYKRSAIDSTSLMCAGDDVVLFSNYMWNWQYNLTLAQQIKTLNPKCIIVFGGPQVSEHRLESQQAQYPFVDTWIISEGELSFRQFTDDLLVGRDHIKRQYGAARLEHLDIPSPYLLGFFDDLIEDNPDISWSTTLETNRGCPFKCTFCDWGSLTYAKVKRFPEHKVYQEIEWISRNKIGYVFVADANFGMYPERDMLIAQCMTENQQKYGYPEVWNANWHKNSRQNVIPIVEHLTAGGKNRAMTISVQSMSEGVQTAIERKNMDISHMEDMFELINSKGLASYTELILPLPLETAQSWREGLAEVLRIGQHNSIEIWFHQLLENAESTRSHIDQYGFETRELSGYVSGAIEPGDADILEKTEVVVATNTMTYDEFIDCWQYASMIINFHCGGWTQLASRVRVAQGETDYLTFYDALFDQLNASPCIIGSKWRQQRENLCYFLDGLAPNGFSAHTFLWDFNRVLHENYTASWKFISDTINLEGSLAYAQKELIHNYYDDYPKKIILPANYYEYLNNYSGEPQNGLFEYQINPNNKPDTVEKHLDNLYFKRRMGYGKNTINEIMRKPRGN